MKKAIALALFILTPLAVQAKPMKLQRVVPILVEIPADPRVVGPIASLEPAKAQVIFATLLSIPNTFVPNTPALAEQVNANFTAISTWGNGNIGAGNFNGGGVLQPADGGTGTSTGTCSFCAVTNGMNTFTAVQNFVLGNTNITLQTGTSGTTQTGGIWWGVDQGGQGVVKLHANDANTVAGVTASQLSLENGVTHLLAVDVGGTLGVLNNLSIGGNTIDLANSTSVQVIGTGTTAQFNSAGGIQGTYLPGTIALGYYDPNYQFAGGTGATQTEHGYQSVTTDFSVALSGDCTADTKSCAIASGNTATVSFTSGSVYSCSATARGTGYIPAVAHTSNTTITVSLGNPYSSSLTAAGGPYGVDVLCKGT